MLLVKLLDALQHLQVERGLTRTGLAAELGVSEAYLYRLRNGTRGPGVDFLKAIVRTFPDLIPDVIAFLRDGNEPC